MYTSICHLLRAVNSPSFPKASRQNRSPPPVILRRHGRHDHHDSRPLLSSKMQSIFTHSLLFFRKDSGPPWLSSLFRKIASGADRHRYNQNHQRLPVSPLLIYTPGYCPIVRESQSSLLRIQKRIPLNCYLAIFIPAAAIAF